MPESTASKRWDPAPPVPPDEIKKSRVLMSGTAGIRAQGRKFLPSFPAERPQDYEYRLANSFLYAVFERVVRDITGRIFGRPILMPTEVDAAYDKEYWSDWVRNADYFGRSLDKVIREAFQDAMQTGIVFVTVDAPQRLATETLAAAFMAKPWIETFSAEQVINWEVTMIEGKAVLTAFRLQLDQQTRREYVWTSEGIIINIWRKQENQPNSIGGNEYALVDSRQFPPEIEQIPMVPLYTNQTGYLTALPPLRALADMNLAHYRSSSNYRHILQHVSVPILVGSNLPPDVVISPNATIISKEEASLRYVEHSGEGIGAARQELLDMEEKMDLLGIRFATERLLTQTAAAEVNDRTKEVSRLQLVAEDFEVAVNDLMRLVAQFAGLQWPYPGLALNTDIDEIDTSQNSVHALLTMYSLGAIDQPTLLDAMKRRGIFPQNFDLSNVKERADLGQNPVNVPMGGEPPIRPQRAFKS